MTDVEESDEIVLPALLRAARGAYGRSITAHLAAAGIDDMPRNGPFVLGGMVNHGAPIRGLVRQLGVSREAGALLLDTLVLRGYLERNSDSGDSQTGFIVTKRGEFAAAAVRAGVAAVDAELAELISADEMAGFRAGLIAMCDIRDRLEDEARAAAH